MTAGRLPGRPPGRPPVPAGGAAPEAVEAAARELGGRAVRDGPLGALTTYRVGGPAALLVTAAGIDDLRRVAAALAASGLPALVVGRGSNLLVADAGFGGIAVVLDAGAYGDFEVVSEEDGDALVVQAGGALPLPALARRSVEAGVHGLEWAVGVPGSVGGGVRMNAGGHGSDVAASLRQATIVDLLGPAAGEPRRVGPAELAHGYRRSSVQPTQVVTAAELAGTPGEPQRGRATIRAIVRWRREHQPGGQNAGSVFTNPAPTGDESPRRAGELIEAAGMKGYRLGTAQVSPKHANFIQADPGGSAADVHRLLREVQSRVADRLGVELGTEVRIVGTEPSTSSRDSV
ncbi:MAG: UDP-N-acetylmuramate dehydrogenase [Acidimicrobiales bacterium]